MVYTYGAYTISEIVNKMFIFLNIEFEFELNLCTRFYMSHPRGYLTLETTNTRLLQSLRCQLQTVSIVKSTKPLQPVPPHQPCLSHYFS